MEMPKPYFIISLFPEEEQFDIFNLSEEDLADRLVELVNNEKWVEIGSCFPVYLVDKDRRNSHRLVLSPEAILNILEVKRLVESQSKEVQASLTYQGRGRFTPNGFPKVEPESEEFLRIVEQFIESRKENPTIHVQLEKEQTKQMIKNLLGIDHLEEIRLAYIDNIWECIDWKAADDEFLDEAFIDEFLEAEIDFMVDQYGEESFPEKYSPEKLNDVLYFYGVMEDEQEVFDSFDDPDLASRLISLNEKLMTYEFGEDRFLNFIYEEYDLDLFNSNNRREILSNIIGKERILKVIDWADALSPDMPYMEDLMNNYSVVEVLDEVLPVLGIENPNETYLAPLIEEPDDYVLYDYNIDDDNLIIDFFFTDPLYNEEGTW